MDFSLSEEQKAMRDMAKNFAEKKIAPTMEEDEKEHRFRRELIKEMARLGFFGCIAQRNMVERRAVIWRLQ